MYSSLTGFADIAGTAIADEYIARRSSAVAPGSNGWGTHGITPRHDSQIPLSAAVIGDPQYQGLLSDDLDSGVFRAWEPIATAPAPSASVADMVNLYVRHDLLAPGLGTYELASECDGCAAPFPAGTFRTNVVPGYAGASEDFGHVVFEASWQLTADAPPQPPFPLSFCLFGSPPSGLGCESRVYEFDGTTTRFVGVLPDGMGAVRSIAGRGALNNRTQRVTFRPVSTDGSRIVFTVPTSAAATSGGVYARINGRSTVQLNASERTTCAVGLPGTPPCTPAPDAVRPAQYWDASADHARVFFTSAEALTDDVVVSGDQKLYMWERQAADEQQQVTVDATGGSFTLAFNGRATAAIPFDATADDVRRALEGLDTVKAGNVAVSGGPGAGGGGTPYTVTFTGDFAGANVAQLVANGGGLTGGAATATVATTRPVENLSYLNVDREPGDTSNDVTGVIAASDDGRTVYFATTGQLVRGGTRLSASVGLYRWREGDVRFIGINTSNGFDASTMFTGNQVIAAQLQSRVTRDGRYLLFRTRSGERLLSEHGGVDYVHNDFRQLYVYDGSTGELACASCNFDAASATAEANVMVRVLMGASGTSTYVNRALSSNGQVFFNTAEALVPEDVNGRTDAYEYDMTTGRHRLISSGTDPFDSYFLDASESGDDVFFITRQQLVGWDRDQGYDLYDARVGGGFPEPAPPAPGCSGDVCQGAPGAAPAAAGAGSAAYRGSGNVRAERSRASGRRARRRAKRCKRGKVRRRVRGKVRCVSRKRAARMARARRAAKRRAAHQRRLRIETRQSESTRRAAR